MDEAIGMFKSAPPDGALPDLDSIRSDALQTCEWERDTTWNDALQNLPDDYQMLPCTVHTDSAGCDADHNLDIVKLLIISRNHLYNFSFSDFRSRISFPLIYFETICNTYNKYL